MIKFLLGNLEHLAPILICAIVSMAIILERFKSLFFSYPIRRSRAFFEKVAHLTMSDKINEAVALCERYKRKPAAMIVKEGLLRAHQTEEIIEHGLEIEVSESIDRVRARTGFLSMIANVATLLGLIGTIMGLVQSFEAVGSANPQERSALLALGISTAMNHTLWGLTVAVPTMVAYSFLMNRTNRLKSELDRALVRTLDMLKQRHISSVDKTTNDQKNPRDIRRSA